MLPPRPAYSGLSSVQVHVQLGCASVCNATNSCLTKCIVLSVSCRHSSGKLVSHCLV